MLDANSSFLEAEVPSAKPRLACAKLIRHMCLRFTEHMVPAYRHDRCESKSVPMRLYRLTPAHCTALVSVLSAVVLTSLLIDVTASDVLVTQSVLATTLPSGGSAVNLSSGPFVLRSTSLTPFSQQLHISAIYETAALTSESFDQQFMVTVDIEGARHNRDRVKLDDQQRLYNRSRLLSCHGDHCQPVPIITLTHLTFNKYVILVSTRGLRDLNSRYPIENITFQLKSVKLGFSYLQLCSRALLLTCSALAAVWFVCRLRRCAVQNWALEQKWTGSSLVGLALYNNPLYPLCLLSGELVWRLVDHVLHFSFVCWLLLYWLCLVHGVRQSFRSWLRFYVPKLAVVGALWLLLVVLVSWHTFEQSHDPAYVWSEDSMLQSVANGVYVTGTVYSVYLLILLARTHSELASMPALGRRLKFAVAVMAPLPVWAGLLLLKEGGALAPLLAVDGVRCRLVLTDLLINVCVLAMAWTHSPPPDRQLSATGEGVLRDNISLSMTADESAEDEDDEDVLYDETDPRLPLYRTSHQDDSD